MKFKILLIVFLCLPMGYLAYNLQDAVDPIKYIYKITGTTAVILLMITLSLTPFRRFVNLVKYRRMIGLFTFFYVFLHFLNFVILGTQLDLSLVIKETYEKPFVYLGMISFAILLFMSITSTKKLFKKYNKWHRLVYIALVLVVIHASMAQKVLSWREYTYIIIVFVILSLKIDLKKIFSKF